MSNDPTDPAETIRRGMDFLLKATEAACRQRPPGFLRVPFPFTPDEIRAVPPDKRNAFLRTVESVGVLVTPDQLQALYDIGLERPGDEA